VGFARFEVEKETVSFSDNFFRIGRRAAKEAYLRFLFFTGLLWWARTRIAKLGVVVITLHRVLPDEQYDSAQAQPGMAVRASTFERFLEYVSRYCECVRPVGAVPGQPKVRRPRLALTFDDGWKDNFETAFPISRKYGIQFTVFICPQMMTCRDSFWTSQAGSLWAAAQQAGKLEMISSLCGPQASRSAESFIESLKHANPKDRETVIGQLQAALQLCAQGAGVESSEQMLTWRDVKEMSAAGIAFGSHTNTHPILTDIPASAAIQELAESKSAIEAELNACLLFAYPNGDWSPQVRDLVAQAGYQAAFINSPGIWQEHSHRLSIPRVNLWEGSLTGPGGRFSRLTLEYAIFWKAYRAASNDRT
jgi:peptidoglycan/xylan/chitin deacetylase (PgdA/CDA1 family)